MEKIPSLRDFFVIIFKHKLGIFLLFAIIVSTLTILTYVWPFTYEASAKILVKFERENISLSGSSPSSPAVLTMRETEEKIYSEIEILDNKYLIEKVVRHCWDDLTRISIEEPTSIWGKIKAVCRKMLHSTVKTISEIGYSFGLIRNKTVASPP